MNDILPKVEEFVTTLLSTQLENKYLYHSLAHTQRVVSKSKELTDQAELSEKQTMLILIAAWFHDTGFTIKVENHEEESVVIATDFLSAQNVSPEDIKAVCDIIRVTKMESQPKNELEAILKDADCAHVSSKNYDEYAGLLKKEWELTSGLKYNNLEWIEKNISFISNHNYYSLVANNSWSQQKNRNLARLLKSLKKAKADKIKIRQKEEALELKKEKRDIPDRGIETMFRVALKNHLTLSDIADTKANILLSVNAIIISVALSNLIPKLDNPSNSYLIYPTLIFVGFTVICVILSVLATRPNVTEGTFTKEDVANKKVNILFFGNFHQMNFEDFDWAMQEVMEDKRYLYGNLTKDLYYLGLVLNRKYKLLRFTYTVFMIGIIITVFSFLISFLLIDTPAN